MKTIIACTIIIVSIFLVGCDSVSSSEESSVKTPSSFVKFEQVGYLKADNNLRYFTFWLNTNAAIKSDTLSPELLDKIRKHGSSQMNTRGQVTASFYYLEKSQTPDITLLSAQNANDVAHNKKPIATVWIMPNGQVNLFEKPE